MTNERDIISLIENTNDHFKKIDVLVNCAGVLGSDATLFDQTAEDWDRIFDVNLKGSWMNTPMVEGILNGPNGLRKR
jgi:NAD(P)-dependent dehydrogenase (short-subunit alcohol dehydrogenase family)